MVFENCICFQLSRATRKITKQYRDRISAHGLTHGQFFMLIAILEEDGISPSRIAAKTALDRPTTTGLLDRLERDGWIERRSDPNDRRTLRIHLSEKSREQKEALFSIFREINDHFLARFTPEEWKQFLFFLEKLD